MLLTKIRIMTALWVAKGDPTEGVIPAVVPLILLILLVGSILVAILVLAIREFLGY